MKKTIYLFSGLFTAAFSTSCTKDYTCECTVTGTETYTYNGVTQTYTDTYVTSVNHLKMPLDMRLNLTA